MARNLELQINRPGKKNYSLVVPGCWNELSKKQMLAGTRLLFSGMQKPILQIELLRILMPIPKKVFFALEPWQLLELKQLTGFFYKNPALTRQLLPSFRIGFRQYAGPKENFRNLQLLEFIYADTFFLQWHAKQEPEILDKLIAVLYRPQKRFLIFRKRLNSYNGDPRQAFNQHFVNDRALRVGKLSNELKYAILTWYRSCRLWLEKRYPHVFSNDNQDQAKKQGTWEPVLRNMAGGKFGDIYKTGEANLLTILQEMDDTIAAAEKAKENLKH